MTALVAFYCDQLGCVVLSSVLSSSPSKDVLAFYAVGQGAFRYRAEHRLWRKMSGRPIGARPVGRGVSTFNSRSAAAIVWAPH
jgi:hypothetical protein